MFMWKLGEYITYPTMLMKLYLANNRKNEDIHKAEVFYGQKREQYCSLYYPTDKPTKKEIVYFIHGGGWRMGSPKLFSFIGNFFAKAGYVTVMAGYRLAPESQYPQQMEDIYIGFRKMSEILKNNYDKHGKIIVMGKSAGAHLGSLLVYNKDMQAKYNIKQDEFGGFVSISGPLNFNQCINKDIKKLLYDFLGSTPWDKANPINFVDGSEKIPVLCIHGERDPLVEVENSITFVDLIKKHQVEMAKLVIVNGKHHSDVAAGLFLKNNNVRKRLLEWMEKLENRRF